MIIMSEDKFMIEQLSPDDSHLLVLALFSEENDIPELTPMARLVYSVIKSKNDRISEKQKEFSVKQSEKGKKGGAPKNNQNAIKQAETSQNNPNNPNNPKQAETSLTVTDSVTDSVTVTEDIPATAAARAKDETPERNDRAVAIQAWEQAKGRPVTSQECEHIFAWLKEMPLETVLLAIDRAACEGAQRWSYVQAILRDWKEKGISTPVQARNETVDFQNRARPPTAQPRIRAAPSSQPKKRGFTAGEAPPGERERAAVEALRRESAALKGA